MPTHQVAELVGSDDVECPEEDIFAAVLAWVKENEGVRKAELDRLLPLVRFPLMAKPGLLIAAEPLVATHPLAFQLIFETYLDFAESEQAAGCPRLQPRACTHHQAQSQALPFTRFAADLYAAMEGGIVLQTAAAAAIHFSCQPAVCARHVMVVGRHAANFTVVSKNDTTKTSVASRSDWRARRSTWNITH